MENSFDSISKIETIPSDPSLISVKLQKMFTSAFQLMLWAVMFILWFCCKTKNNLCIKSLGLYLIATKVLVATQSVPEPEPELQTQKRYDYLKGLGEDNGNLRWMLNETYSFLGSSEGKCILLAGDVNDPNFYIGGYATVDYVLGSHRVDFTILKITSSSRELWRITGDGLTEIGRAHV